MTHKPARDILISSWLIFQQFCREALLWQRLKHPFLLPFLGIDSQSFPSFLCMVSPWMRHGTISKHLEDYGNANVDGLVSFLFSSICSLVIFF